MEERARIIVVDDEPGLRLVLTRMLRMAGYEVWEAANGSEFLHLARSYPPDLVLMDVILSDTTGFNLCRRIREEPLFSDAIVILMSGKVFDEEDRRRGAELGAADYLQRPVAMDDFLARVAAALAEADTSP